MSGFTSSSYSRESAVSDPSTRLGLEASDLAEGKLNVFWEGRKIDEIQISWTDHSGTKKGVDLTGKNLETLAAHIYEMYAEELTSTSQSTKGFSTVNAKVRLGEVDAVQRDGVDQTAQMKGTAQKVCNLVLGAPIMAGSPVQNAKATTKMQDHSVVRLHDEDPQTSGHFRTESVRALAHGRIKDLAALDAAYQEIDRLREALKRANQNLDKLQGNRSYNLENHSAEANATLEEIGDLYVRLNEASRFIDLLKKRMHQSGQDKRTIEERFNQLQAAHQNLLSDSESLVLGQEQIRTLFASVDQQKDAILTLQEQLEGLIKNLKSKETTLAHLQSSGRAEDQETIAGLQTEVTIAKEELASKQREINRSVGQYEDLVRGLTDELTSLRQKVKELEITVGEGNNLLAQRDHDLSQRQADIEDQRKNIEALKERITSNTELISQLLDQLSQAERGQQALQNMLPVGIEPDKIQGTLKDLQEEVSKLKALLKQANQEKEELNRQLEALRSVNLSNHELQKDIQELKPRVEELEQSLTQKDQELERLKDLESRLAQVTGALGASEEQREKLVTDLADLKKLLFSAKTSNEKAVLALKKQLTELKGEQDKRDSLIAEKEDLIRSLARQTGIDKEDLQQQLKSMQGSLQDYINKSNLHDNNFRSLLGQVNSSLENVDRSLALGEPESLSNFTIEELVGLVDEKISDLGNSAKQAQLARKRLENSAQTLQTQLEKDVEEKSLEITRLQRLLAGQQGEILSLKGRVKELDANQQSLQGRVTGLEADQQSLQGRVTDLETEKSNLELEYKKQATEIDKLRQAINPSNIVVHLQVDTSKDLNYTQFEAALKRFEKEAAELISEVIEEAPESIEAEIASRAAAADNIKKLVESIPAAISTASVDALISKEVADNIELYAQVLDELIKYSNPNDRKDLILNLMLVVANHSKESVSSLAKDYLIQVMKEERQSSNRTLQIASALSNKPGYVEQGIAQQVWNMSEAVSVNASDTASIQNRAMKQIELLDGRLEKDVLPNEERQELKALVTTMIRSYLSELSYVTSSDGAVERLVEHVRKTGDLPVGMSSFLIADKDQDKKHLEALSKMIYLYSACDSNDRNRFKSVASLERLSWLTEGRTSDKQAFALLQFVKSCPKGIAFTHEQALWGRKVAHSMKGDAVDPIYAPGGAGKTVTVQHFMRLLHKLELADSTEKKSAPMVFVSPFAQKHTEESSIATKMLPPPRNDQIQINMPSADRLKDARVVIDECHIIRPKTKVYLTASAGTSSQITKVAVPQYLQLTATPLTAGYDLKRAIETELDAVRQQRIKFERNLQALGGKGEQNLERAIAAVKKLISDSQIEQVCKVQSHINDKLRKLKTKLNSATEDFSKGQITRDNLLSEINSFIGGALSENNGLLGNTQTLKALKDYPALLRKIEYCALQIDPVKAEAYAKSTTQVTSQGSSQAVKLVPLSSTQNSLDKAFNESVQTELAKNRKYVAQTALEKAIDTLKKQEEELKTALDECKRSKDLQLYKETKKKRDKALSSMDVSFKDSITSWATQKENCIAGISQELAQLTEAESSRVQIILPGLRFDEDSLKSIVDGLKPESGVKGRVFIYHDSHSSENSPEYGQDFCVFWDDKGVKQKLTLKEYKEQFANSNETSIFAESKFPHQVVMLYDDTNKQGGDFGIFSESDIKANAPISQLIFLNITQNTEQNPASSLTSGDMYQCHCRRRGVDDIPPPKVFASVSNTYSSMSSEDKKRVLLRVPSQVLLETLSHSANSETEKSLLSTIANDHAAIVKRFMQLPDDKIDSKLLSLVASLQEQQEELESFLHQTGAIAHIATKLLHIQESLKKLPAISESSSTARAAASENEAYVSESRRKALQELSGRISILTDPDGNSVDKLKNIGQTIEVAKRVFGEIQADYQSKLANAVGAALDTNAESVSLKPSIENELYNVVIKALSTLEQAEAYRQQALGIDV